MTLPPNSRDLGECPFCLGNPGRVHSSVETAEVYHSHPPCRMFAQSHGALFLQAIERKIKARARA